MRKEKFALKKIDIIKYDLDSKFDNILTVKRLVQIAKKTEQLAKYLPENAENRVSKRWIVDVLHSVDSTFFDRVTESIDVKKKELKPLKLEEEFDVDADMVECLKEYNQDRTFNPSKKAFARILKPSKKRTRKDQKKDWAYLDAMEARWERK